LGKDSLIIHCTQKLAKNLKDVSKTSLVETSPLGSWHANIYTIDSRKCVLFCHDTTRYVLFMAGLRKPEFMDFGAVHRRLFLEALAEQGIPAIQVKKVELALGPTSFDCATDRSVLGSLNQTRFDLEGWFCEINNIMELSPLAVSAHMNKRPMTIRRKWVFAKEAMQELITAL
jgi:hypothetical protein